MSNRTVLELLLLAVAIYAALRILAFLRNVGRPVIEPVKDVIDETVRPAAERLEAQVESKLREHRLGWIADEGAALTRISRGLAGVVVRAIDAVDPARKKQP